ncbi:MAG TPA: hypothetical protein PL018_12330 [Ignavibacteriaceae bacterium]|nr:hypothetical protein [Ignavibacteriaceae bacterium]
MTKDRIKKLELKFVITIPKSLKIVYISPGDNKKEILKKYNPKDILVLEFV